MFEDKKPEKPLNANALLVKQLTLPELLRLREEIDKLLPPLSIAEMNLEQEMVLQYHTLRTVQNDIMDDEEIPLNQRAQLASTCSAQLARLMQLQQEIFTSERIKAMERVLTKLLKAWDKDQAEKFLAEYEKALED